MKPKTADQNDPNVRRHDILLGIPEKKKEIRTELVMKLARMADIIHDFKYREANRQSLAIGFTAILETLTQKELELYFFERGNQGI